MRSWPICPSSSAQKLSCSSTSRPPRRSASNCRRHCLRALMILSNDRILLHCMSPVLAQSDIPVPSVDVRFRGQIGKHLLVQNLPLLNPKPATEVEATSILPLLEREDCTPMACYRSLYAPRTGGAYDSHHRTAGIDGRTRRCGGGVAARGAGTGLSDAAHHHCRALPGWRADRHACAHPRRADEGAARAVSDH